MCVRCINNLFERGGKCKGRKNMAFHLQELIRDKNVGSIAATTGASARRICKRIAFDRCRVIVEYGPGDGALTKLLLGRMRPDAKLIAIETNRRFVDELTQNIRDSRLNVFCDNAENVQSILKRLDIDEVDCIVSGIPFSFLSGQSKRKILAYTKKILRPGGRFLVYQALTAPFQRLRTKRLVSHSFLIARERFLFLNVPPLYLLETIPRAVSGTLSFAIKNFR